MEALKSVLWLTINPVSPADRDRLDVGLRALTAEDPTLEVQTDLQTGQVILAGMGELHLEIIVDRLKREFNVEASVGKPQVAYREGFPDAGGKAGPVLLEPVMHVEVVVPKDYAGDVLATLETRHAQIESQEDRDGIQIIQALAPLSEMLGYATDLRSRTGGRATFTMHLDRYEPRPGGADEDHMSFRGVPRMSPPTGTLSAAVVPEPEDDAPA